MAPVFHIERLTISLASILLVTALGVGSAAQTSPEKKFYKDWKMDDLLPSVKDLGIGHDFVQGRDLFRKTGCGVCHAFGSESEGTGLTPDLTAVSSKMTRDAILRDILEPSATLNGQFFHTAFTMKDGTVVTGSVIDIVDKKTIIVAPVMMNPQATVEIAAADVKSEAPSTDLADAGRAAERIDEGAGRAADGLPGVRRRPQRPDLFEEMIRRGHRR